MPFILFWPMVENGMALIPLDNFYKHEDKEQRMTNLPTD
jgi:hypothetical protein